MDALAQAADWTNANQGVVSVAIFVLTLFLGWTSGVFASLRRKPKLSFELIEGPTFCSVISTGAKHKDFDVHRTVFALYLQIANIGSAPTSIKSVSIGYHWDIVPISWNWLRYRIGWFWIHDQAVALTDFQVEIGDSVKFFPFLFQKSVISGERPDTFLDAAQSTSGVLYFEQPDSWGGCQPLPIRGRTKILVSVTDVYGTRFKRRFWIPIVSVTDAKKYNPSFGETTFALRRGPTKSQPSAPAE